MSVHFYPWIAETFNSSERPRSIPSKKIGGLDFFSNRADCIASYENLSLGSKVFLTIKNCFSEIAHVFYKLSSILQLKQAEAEMKGYIQPGNLTKSRLVVCFHGLGGKATQFLEILSEFKSDQYRTEFSETDIYTPLIVAKGHAKLDDMVQPIFETIQAWSKKGGDKELVLVGISNGSRVARAVLAEVNKDPNSIKRVKFVSIVGACQGSRLVNLANSLGCAWINRTFGINWPLTRAISDEMPCESDRNKRLNQDWANTCQAVPSRYSFIASPFDVLVPNNDSTLLEVGNLSKRYAFAHEYGHNSIVRPVAKAVAHLVFEKI